MKSLVINRFDRPERLSATQEQFNRYSWDVEVFPAIMNGWQGCRDSHLTLLEKYRNEETLLIFEDDVLFVNNPVMLIPQAMANLPELWDMLYLGISPLRPYNRYSNHLFRVDGGHTTHAIIWHNRPNGAVEYILNHRNDILKWDTYLSMEIHKIFNCFVIFPLLCTQRQEKSDTCHRSDASSIIRNYNRFIV